MPRIARIASGGVVQHVLNRGNGRMKLFHKRQYYQAFVDLLGEAMDRVPGISLLGWCLMPNHWHLVLLPAGDGDLPAFMRWLSNTHGGGGGSTGIRSGRGTSIRADTKTSPFRTTSTTSRCCVTLKPTPFARNWSAGRRTGRGAA